MDKPVPDRKSRYLDNTMISSYKECPRKYMLRHILNWRGQGTSLPICFGLSWHNAMDVVWTLAKESPKKELPRLALASFYEKWEEMGLPSDLPVEEIERYAPRTPMIAAEMLVSYIDKRWSMLQDCDLIAAESPFAVPLPGAEDTWYVGRLDKVISYKGQGLVIEHKTTSTYKKDGGFQLSYIESWYSDSQVKGYQFGGGLFFGVSQVWVDAALVHKSVHDAFRFVPVAHQFPLLQEWVDDTRQWVARLESDTAKFESRGELGLGIFPKNEGSCMGKFGPCPYLDICRTTPDPSKLEEVPSGYVVEAWQPFELLGLDKLTQGETT